MHSQSSSKAGAKILEKLAIQRKRREGELAPDVDPLLLPIRMTLVERHYVFFLCWFNVFRCAFYGLLSGGANAGITVITDKYLPVRALRALSTTLWGAHP